MGKSDYYATLEIPRDALEEDVKKSYRKLAMKYHPDRNQGDKAAEEKFKEINEAYEILSNPEKRQQYDQFGCVGNSGAGCYTDPFAGFGDMFRGGGSFHFNLDEMNFGFGPEMHRRTASRTASRPGNHIETLLHLTFEEAVFGTNKQVSYHTMVECTSCCGTGSEGTAKEIMCPACQGTGQTFQVQGYFRIGAPCARCQGTGRIIENPCKQCGGEGRIRQPRTVDVNCPPGVDTGMKLRMQGAGECGYRKGPAGDLYVMINVQPHSRFEREGSNLHLIVPITFTQAALGSTVDIDLLGGAKKTINITPGTQPGSSLMFSGEGISSVHTRVKGDFYIRFTVHIPTVLTDQQRALLNQFAETEKENLNV